MSSFPKFDRSVSCLAWAYNERLLIEPFLTRLNHLLSETVEDYEIVIVDDGSTDGTGEMIQSLQEQIPQIRLVTHPRNLNVGISAQRAIQAATKEYLFWQTVDWAYDLKDLRSHLELLRNFDVVAGSRLAPIPRSWPWHRKLNGYLKMFYWSYLKVRSDTPLKALVSITNYLLIRALFGVPLTDYQNVVIYPTKLIQSIRFESRSSFSNPEALLKTCWRGARIAEVPIPFIPRPAGEAKGTELKAIWASVRDVLGLWFRWVILRRMNFRSLGKIVRMNPEETFQVKLNWDPAAGKIPA